MFTDIVSSTSELERIGTAAWSDVIARHRHHVAAASRPHGGRLVAFLGDGYLVVFSEARAGASAALQLQSSLVGSDNTGVKIGMETGDAIPIGPDDYVGLCVHTAARLCEHGTGGQLLIGDGCFTRASDVLAMEPLQTLMLPLKGLRRPVTAHLSEAPVFAAIA